MHPAPACYRRTFVPPLSMKVTPARTHVLAPARSKRPRAVPPVPAAEPVPAAPAVSPVPAEPSAPLSLRGVLRRSAVRRALGDPGLRMRVGFLEAFEAKVVEDLLRSVARAKAHKRSTLLPADV